MKRIIDNNNFTPETNEHMINKQDWNSMLRGEEERGFVVFEKK